MKAAKSARHQQPNAFGNHSHIGAVNNVFALLVDCACDLPPRRYRRSASRPTEPVPDGRKVSVLVLGYLCQKASRAFSPPVIGLIKYPVPSPCQPRSFRYSFWIPSRRRSPYSFLPSFRLRTLPTMAHFAPPRPPSGERPYAGARARGFARGLEAPSNPRARPSSGKTEWT